MKIEMEYGNTIDWDGPGTYVARRMRGPTHYVKLPEGKKPVGDVVVCEFAKKPEKRGSSKGKGGLWR